MMERLGFPVLEDGTYKSCCTSVQWIETFTPDWEAP